MANYLQFRIHNLDVTSFSSLSDIPKMLASITNRSLIWIQDSAHCATPGILPDRNIIQLRCSCLKEFVRCHEGDELIIVFSTNSRDLHEAAQRCLKATEIYIFSPSPVALPAKGEIVDEGEIMELYSFEQKPLERFDAMNNGAHQSSVFVPYIERKNTREASNRQCMTEGVLNVVDPTTKISSKDFDAPDNIANLLRAHQGSPIVFNSEKKDTIEGVGGECLTKSVLSLDDYGKQEPLLDFDASVNKAYLFRADKIASVVSLSENKNRGEASKSNITSILGSEDLQQPFGDSGDDAAKIFCHGRSSTVKTEGKSSEVVETFPTKEQPIDCVQQEKTPYLPRGMQINGVEQRVTKMPRYLGELTAQSASSSGWPIGLPDGGHIVLLHPLDQSTENIEHVAGEDQCSPPVFLAEKKMVRNTLKRKCGMMNVIFEGNHQHFGKICASAAKSLGAMHICTKHGINQASMLKWIYKQHLNQWPFRQKWATRKGYSLGDKRPSEVSRLSMDKILASRSPFINTSQYATSLPPCLALRDESNVVGPVDLSSIHPAQQDQSSSTASLCERKNTREMSDRLGIVSLCSVENRQEHFGCKNKDAVNRLDVNISMFKSTCGQHRVWWPCRIKSDEQSAFVARKDTAHLAKPDQRSPTVSNSEKGSKTEALKEKRDRLTLKQHFGARHKDAAKGLCDSLAWKLFKILESPPICKESDGIRHLVPWKTLTLEHGVQLKESQDLPPSLQMNCSGGLSRQSASDLPVRGHVIYLSEKKMVRKTLKGKSRTKSVLSSEDHHQNADKRWGNTVKRLGAKHISRQLALRRPSTAKCTRKQHGIHRWPFQQDQATVKGYYLVGQRPVEVISLSMGWNHWILVSRLRIIYLSWRVRYSPRPSALSGAGRIVGRIALSSSEFTTTNNQADLARQDQRGSTSSHSGNKRARETVNGQVRNTKFTLQDLQECVGLKRIDAANLLDVSEPTFKRRCRELGITDWRNWRGIRVWKPPDPPPDPRRRIASPTCQRSSSQGQTQKENQMVDLPAEPNGLRSDLLVGSVTENPVARNLESPAFHNDGMNFNISSFFEEMERELMGSHEEAFHCTDQPTLSAPHLEAHGSGSTYGIVPDPTLIQPMSSIPCTIPTTTPMMPPLTPSQDTSSVTVKAYADNNNTLRFQLPLTSGVDKLKDKVAMRLKLRNESFELKYEDDERELILIACDEDLSTCLQHFSSLPNPIVKLVVVRNQLV